MTGCGKEPLIPHRDEWWHSLIFSFLFFSSSSLSPSPFYLAISPAQPSPFLFSFPETNMWHVIYSSLDWLHVRQCSQVVCSYDKVIMQIYPSTPQPKCFMNRRTKLNRTPSIHPCLQHVRQNSSEYTSNDLCSFVTIHRDKTSADGAGWSPSCTRHQVTLNT